MKIRRWKRKSNGIASKCCLVFIAWTLLISPLAVMGDVNSPENSVNGSGSLPSQLNYVTHTPIRINSDAEFATMAGAEGWNGNGSQLDPWIIENYDIDGTGYGYCLYIGNTTNYFIVKDCSFHGANRGLYFSNVDYGCILNNTIRLNTECGIDIWFSDYITVLNNTISDMKGKGDEDGEPATGISLTQSSHNILRGNTLFNISGGDFSPWRTIGCGRGIHLYYSSDNVLMDNDISDVNIGELVYFRDDMESGSEKWEHSSTILLINGEGPLEYYYDTELDTDIISEWNNTISNGLEITTVTCRSYDSCFYLNGTSDNKTAVTDPFSLGGLKSANLNFWQKYNITPDENGVFLQVGYKDPSAPDEWDWKYITPAAYTGSLNASSQVNDSFGTPIQECWSGVSEGGSFDWEQVGLDILEHVPVAYRDEVRVKFNYTYIGGGASVGWYIDDLRLVVSRDENATISANDKDVWNLTDAMGHSGNHCWSNVDPVTGYMKPGIDNYLTTKPIDITSVKNAYLTAYLKFNINEDYGAPMDGFRVEVTKDNGVTWQAINMGVRAAWSVSGTGTDGGDGNPTDGKAWTGLPDSGDPVADDYWIEANTLSRINANLSAFKGYVIQIRFRVVTSNNLSYEHNNNLNYPDPGFGGFYVDDVEVYGENIFSFYDPWSAGISFVASDANVISNNTLSTNSYGVSLLSSSVNVIYHNNFINNTFQAYDSDINQWDNGYPSGGNYWSDFNGADTYHGPNQNYSGSDGIGDSNYTKIYGGSNVDNYPLMMPWNPTPPIADAGPDQWVDEDIEVYFDGSGSIDSQRIVNYTWTFYDDGSLVCLYGVNSSYIFANPGIYVVTLNTSVTGGVWDTDTCTIHINDTKSPFANAGPDQWAELNEDGYVSVYFDGSASSDNGGIVNHTWSFYDNSELFFLYGANPSYVFTRPGSYIVTLNIMDGAGFWDTDSCTVHVNDSISPTISDVIVTPSTPTNRDNITVVCNVSDNVEVAYVNFTYLHNGTTWKTIPMICDTLPLYRAIFGPINQNFTYFINSTDTSGNMAAYSGAVVVRKAQLDGTSEGLDPEQGLESGMTIQITGNVFIDGEVNATGLYIIALFNGEEIARCPVQENGTYLLEFILPELASDDNTLEILLIDTIGGEEKQLNSMIIPGKYPFPWFLVIFGSVICASAALGLATEVGKYSLLLLFLPLYAKLRKEKVLDSFSRGKIYGYIMANPGEHYNAIKRALNMNNGSLAYHLSVLEKENLIKSKTNGIYKRFYPKDMIIPNGGPEILTEAQKLILKSIEETPGISQKDIAALLGVSAPTVHYHINKLMEINAVRTERKGMRVKYYKTPISTTDLSAISTPMSTSPVQSVDDITPTEVETKECPGCNMFVEIGMTTCPFCDISLEKKEGQDALQRSLVEKLENAYKEGKMSESMYLRNRKKFGG